MALLKNILKQIDRLFKQYNELAEMDSALPLKGRYSAGLFIAFRPWVFSMLAELRKKNLEDAGASQLSGWQPSVNSSRSLLAEAFI
jgi:hypothetical protein